MGDVSLGKSAYLGEAVVPVGCTLGRVQWLARFFFKFSVVGVHKIVAVNERKRTVLLRFMNAAVHEQKNQTGRVLNELNEHS